MEEVSRIVSVREECHCWLYSNGKERAIIQGVWVVSGKWKSQEKSFSLRTSIKELNPSGTLILAQCDTFQTSDL